MGFPGCASGKESAWQCRRLKRCGFNPWVRKIPWRRKCHPTQVFLWGESQGQRSLVATVHGVTNSQILLSIWAHNNLYNSKPNNWFSVLIYLTNQQQLPELSTSFSVIHFQHFASRTSYSLGFNNLLDTSQSSLLLLLLLYDLLILWFPHISIFTYYSIVPPRWWHWILCFKM